MTKAKRLPPMLLAGFGPLVLVVLVLLLTMLLAPSVAPERLVPDTGATTTTAVPGG